MAACRRVTPSLRQIFDTWKLIVLSATPRMVAISQLLLPWATQWRQCFSRGVRYRFIEIIRTFTTKYYLIILNCSVINQNLLVVFQKILIYVWFCRQGGLSACCSTRLDHYSSRCQSIAGMLESSLNFVAPICLI